VLNHPTTSTQKSTPAKTHVSQASEPTVIKPPSSTSQPTVAVKNPEPKPSLTRHSNTITTGRPPKIEALISSAMAKSSIASERLHDAAEIHSSLQEALKQQASIFSYCIY
jgi:ABC-type transporter Mla subunit MlaD